MNDNLLDSLKGGCTVYGIIEARIIRELKYKHPEWIELVTGEDLEFVLEKKMSDMEAEPYFGAILTEEGKRNLKEIEKELRALIIGDETAGIVITKMVNRCGECPYITASINDPKQRCALTEKYLEYSDIYEQVPELCPFRRGR